MPRNCRQHAIWSTLSRAVKSNFETDKFSNFFTLHNVVMDLPESAMKAQSTIDSEGFKGGTRGAPIMPRDAVSRTAHVGTVVT